MDSCKVSDSREPGVVQFPSHDQGRGAGLEPFPPTQGESIPDRQGAEVCTASKADSQVWAGTIVGPRVCCPFVLPHVRDLVTPEGEPCPLYLTPRLVACMFWAPWWMHPVPWPFLSPWDKLSTHFVCKSLILLLVKPSQRLGVTAPPPGATWLSLVNRALSKGLGASLPSTVLLGPFLLSQHPSLWSTRLAPLSPPLSVTSPFTSSRRPHPHHC